MFRILLSRLLGVIVALVALAWVAGEITYPGEQAQNRYLGVIVSQESDALLRRACFDCHSSAAPRPLYARFPIANLIIGHHIREGREELNFSTWQQMSAKARRHALKESLETLDEGEMPPWDYALFNGEKTLSATEVQRLRRDIATFGGISAEGAGGQTGDQYGGKDDDDDDDDEKGHKEQD